MMNPTKINNAEMEARYHTWEPVTYQTKHECYVRRSKKHENEITKILENGTFGSLKNLYDGKESLVIAYIPSQDNSTKELKGLQMACIWNDEVYEFRFLSKPGSRFEMDEILDVIISTTQATKAVDIRKVRSYTSCACLDDKGRPIVQSYDTLEAAEKNAKYICLDQNFEPIMVKDANKHTSNYHTTKVMKKKCERLSVTLLLYEGKNSIIYLAMESKNMYLPKKSLLFDKNCCYLPRPITAEVMTKSRRKNNNGTYVYPVTCQIADGARHLPEGITLDLLADQFDLHSVEQDDMDKAATECMALLLYCTVLYGANKAMPYSVVATVARKMAEFMKETCGAETDEEFALMYQGKVTVNKGKKDRGDRLETVMQNEYIDHDASMVQDMCTKAFHGGYNICSTPGIYSNLTYDVDLKNAYPTAMVLVPDIDWQNPIVKLVREEELLLDYWREGDDYDPILPFVGVVTFRFPEDVKYPNIPVYVEGTPCYPLRSDKEVYVTGPEVYLALRLGAQVYCKTGYFLRPRHDADGNMYHTLGAAVKPFIQDRANAKELFQEESIVESLLKLMGNAEYGKISQGIKEKEKRCKVTNPYAAAMITSIIRTVLIAALNQSDADEYRDYSATTDGLITDMPLQELNDMDLYGLKACMERSRAYLTDGQDISVWAIKHWQTDLVNYTTRGNVSLSMNGVCAHAGVPTGFIKKSPEDRESLMISGLERTAEQVEYRRLDFDMKRKPIRESFCESGITINGKQYQTVNFRTEPYQDVKEFESYWKHARSKCKCLRTMEDWEHFWSVLSRSNCKARGKDLEWLKIRSCVTGHLSDMWVIPALTHGSRQEKVDWINKHNRSGKTFTVSDFKNAGRVDRRDSILPREEIQDLLEEMQADDRECV